ncbi:ATP-binding protein [Kallotenue papyrolyticum]|uniref:ATP-binding protein n=1 Tax=Kallotenue papyrolyticum TaxID=1325125 RepID=UPI0004785A63|nr:ATP-binding protein [Kallotenue papyrolyticum]
MVDRPPVYPFAALVGQDQLKLALLLALINPAIGGVLLEGPYGVGKTTAVRALLDLMPPVTRPLCRHGCTPDEPEALCPACRERLQRGESLLITEPMRLIELPLNARLEDVVGGINERVALEQRRVLLEPGVLAVAHGNVLYVDEINLLDAAIADAILDAAAQGRTFVRRGAMISLYPSRFVLIGSMNPEEGRLRPQILDRFGLRVWVAPLEAGAERLEALRRARAFQADAEDFRARYAAETAALAGQVLVARAGLPAIQPDEAAERLAITLVDMLGIPSQRAEIVLLEAARALAALEGRPAAQADDVRRVAPLVLRQRRSETIACEAQRVAEEQALIQQALAQATRHEAAARRR